jgi:hypothetical protein
MSQPFENLSLTNPDGAVAHVRGAASLTTWSTDNSIKEVSLDQLSAFDRITVTTRNNTYEIVVTSPRTAAVLVRGGHFFPELTMARLDGSSFGGNFLKTRSVNVGLRLEFILPGGRSVITTPVCSINVIPSIEEVASAEDPCAG